MVELKHLKTSKIDQQTTKYWFAFIKRPRQAFVIYLDLFDATGHKEPFRCQVAALPSKQFKEFDKEKISYGHFDVPVPSDVTPFVSFAYYAKTGVLLNKKTQVLKGEINPEIEDLADPRLQAKFLEMMHDSNKNQKS